VVRCRLDVAGDASGALPGQHPLIRPGWVCFLGRYFIALYTAAMLRVLFYRMWVMGVFFSGRRFACCSGGGYDSGARESGVGFGFDLSLRTAKDAGDWNCG
jgi:hypothetical protein